MSETTHLEQHPDHPEAFDGPLLEARLVEDPRTDVEALCLCALLWAPRPAAAAVTRLLTGTDFHDPTHGDLFTVIATHVDSGRPHDPASIAATLTDTGQAAGHHGAQLTRALTRATSAGATPEAAGHYALAVATAGYRRGFHAAATALTQASEQLPTDDLFDHLLALGRERRTATTRLHQLRTTLDTPPAPVRSAGALRVVPTAAAS